MQNIFMNMAFNFSERSTCIRKKVGAVFTDGEMSRVICFGYNGGIPGDDNQCDDLKEGSCGCLHAETSACSKANESLKGSILFVTLSPCKMCAKLLLCRKISTVYYLNAYRDRTGTDLLKQYGVKVFSWNDYVLNRLSVSI
jgi:dCMP deaminase